MNSQRKGLALIAAIMLIVFVSLSTLGLSVFIAGWYKQIDDKERQSRCIYNAQAGVNYALYQYRNSATLTSGTVALDANNNFTLSTTATYPMAQYLQVDGRSAYDDLDSCKGVTLTNTSTSAITIKGMVISWGWKLFWLQGLENVRINGVDNWSGLLIDGCPRTITFSTNATIAAGATVPLTRIHWSLSIWLTRITIAFIMTDNSQTANCIVLFPTPSAVCNTSLALTGLTVKAMGTTTGSSQYRSVQADYTTATAKVTDYDEISTVVP